MYPTRMVHNDTIITFIYILLILPTLLHGQSRAHQLQLQFFLSICKNLHDNIISGPQINVG